MLPASLLTYANIRAQVAQWSIQNFASQPAEFPFGGIGEEIGELQHAVLKANQGIRGTLEDHTTAAKDAVGDIFIYVCDFSSRAGFGDTMFHFTSKQVDVPVTPKITDAGSMKACRAIFRVYGMLATMMDTDASGAAAMRNRLYLLVQELETFSARYLGTTLQQVASDVWQGIVVKRNWVYDPSGGTTQPA